MHRVAFAGVMALGCALAASAAITSSQAAMLATSARAAQDLRAVIPPESWDRARCVIVVPEVKRSAPAASGESGQGVMSCRAGEGWSAPVFMQLATGSGALHAGAEQVDVVLLVMNESGVQKLLADRLDLGTDVSVASGPIGPHGPEPSAAPNAEILSYARAQGLFSGADLSGAVLRPDASADADAYGEAATPRTILAMRSLSAPTQATAFLNALGAAGPAVPSAPPTPGAAPGALPSTGGTAASSISGSTAPAALPTADGDVRARVVALQQAIDRLIVDAETSPVGTTGGAAAGSTAGSDNIVVSRERLMQLRRQLDAILAALDKR